MRRKGGFTFRFPFSLALALTVVAGGSPSFPLAVLTIAVGTADPLSSVLRFFTARTPSDLGSGAGRDLSFGFDAETVVFSFGFVSSASESESELESESESESESSGSPSLADDKVLLESRSLGGDTLELDDDDDEESA